MSDNWKLNRPDLKYSNYFSETPPRWETGKYPHQQTANLEKAAFILMGLSCIPFLGYIFVLATAVVGVVLILRDRLMLGLAAIIVGPLACTVTTFFVWGMFVAAIFSQASRLTPQAFP